MEGTDRMDNLLNLVQLLTSPHWVNFKKVEYDTPGMVANKQDFTTYNALNKDNYEWSRLPLGLFSDIFCSSTRN